MGKEKIFQDNFLSYWLSYLCMTPVVLFHLARGMFASSLNSLWSKVSVLEQYRKHCDLWGKMNLVYKVN